MPCYFQKTWWSGDGSYAPGEPLLDQSWPKPLYRPGWRVRVVVGHDDERGPLTGKAKIKYVNRDSAEGLDFYLVVREKNGEEILVFYYEIIERLPANPA